MNNIERYEQARKLHEEAERAMMVHVRGKIHNFADLARVVLTKKFGGYGWRSDPKIVKALEESLGVWGMIALHGFEITKMSAETITVSNERLMKIHSRPSSIVTHATVARPRVRGGEVEIPVSALSMSDRQFCALIRRGIRGVKRSLLLGEAANLNARVDALQRELRAKQRELDDALALKRQADSLYKSASER